MEIEWAEIENGALDAEDRADALFRVQNLTGVERKFVLELAEHDDHMIIREGKLLKVQEALENKGWVRITTDDVHVDFATRHRIVFTLDGWNALCVLLDQRGE